MSANESHDIDSSQSNNNLACNIYVEDSSLR